MFYISGEVQIKHIFLEGFSLKPRPADQISTISSLHGSSHCGRDGSRTINKSNALSKRTIPARESNEGPQPAWQQRASSVACFN